MNFDIIAKAIPFFLALIALELAWSGGLRKGFYRLNDSLADLSTSLIFSLTGIGVAAAWLWGYSLVQDNWSVQRLLGAPAIPADNPFPASGGVDWNSLGAWFLVLVLVDFLYYWFHRATHQIRFLWACHITHHSSEEFNLTVALRQCAFQRVFEYAFMLPLAFGGVPWYMLLLCHGIVKIYQFWVHTRLIPKLGPLEYVMLTPSHHRVHHGRDPRYIDKNHGGIFIVWDRMFGTYAEEIEEPNYGLAKPLNSWNPIWSNVHGYVEMFRDMARTKHWADKLRIPLKAPGWRPADLGGPVQAPVVGPDYRKFNPPLSAARAIYAFAQFLLLMVGGLVVLRLGKNPEFQHPWPLLAAGLYVVAGLTSLCGHMEGKKWAATGEFVRHAVLALTGIFVIIGPSQNGLWSGTPYPWMMMGVALLSFLWLMLTREAAGSNSSQSPPPLETVSRA